MAGKAARCDRKHAMPNERQGTIRGFSPSHHGERVVTIEGMEQPPPASAEAVRAWDRPLVVVPLFILIAAVGGLFDSFTLSANLLVLAVGGTLIWLGLTGRAGRKPALARVDRQAAWWFAPLLIFAFVELLTFSQKDTVNWPTLSLLADPVLDNYLARSAVYFGWLTAFWGLIRR
jgi:hypothetical protein